MRGADGVRRAKGVLEPRQLPGAREFVRAVVSCRYRLDIRSAAPDNRCRSVVGD